MEAEARGRVPTSDRLPRPFASQKLADFIDASRAVSTWSVKLQQLLGDVERLVNSRTQPGPRAPQALAQRVRVLCARYHLGDAYVYARYTAFFDRINRTKLSRGHKRAWDFLVRALEAGRASAPECELRQPGRNLGDTIQVQ